MTTPRFTVEAKDELIPQLVLRDAQERSEVWLAPSRGALVTRFFDGQRELLYLDSATFLDRSKNVRGGIPVLFPAPGKLENDRWSHAGSSGVLKQHGFARNADWSVMRQQTQTRAEVTLCMESSAETLRDYPWPFRVELTFALSGRELRIEIRVLNTGANAMPYGFGFHPYFVMKLEDKGSARIETGATRVFDNVTKEEHALGELKLGAGESDLHLLDHGSTNSALTTPRGTVRVEGSEAFTRWVIWTLPGKEFICLEPWTCSGNALNTGVGLREVAPGAAQTHWVAIGT